MRSLRLLSMCLVAMLLAACFSARSSPTPVPTVSPTATITSTPLSVTLAQPTETPQAITPQPTVTATPTPTPVNVLGTLTAYFLDVGQGDSILLKGPDVTILIDAGRHDRNDVLPHLERIGIDAIDLLIGTHPHADHIGQFPEVLARYPVNEVWMSGATNTTNTFENAIDAIAESGAAYHEPRAGETYQIGSARIEVLHPDQGSGDLNDGSVAVRVIFGNVAFLFTGDAETGAEHAMIARGYDLRAQILKLGHHGSSTSSSRAFLQAVQPQIAIWSAGLDNSYGHPHNEVIDLLSEMGISVLGTATEGTIIICTNGHTYNLGGCDAPQPPNNSDAGLQTPIVNEQARLRAGPSTDFEQVGLLAAGTLLTPLGRNATGDWIFVQTPDGQQAWIALFLVEHVDTAVLPVTGDTLPTFTPTSAPTVTPTPTITPTTGSVGGCAQGQININTASYEELQAIIQIGPARAEEMLTLRPFRSVDDMVRINGIAAGRLAQIKSQGLACVD